MSCNCCSHIRRCDLIGVPFKKSLISWPLAHLKRNDEIMPSSFDSCPAQALLSVYIQEYYQTYFFSVTGLQLNTRFKQSRSFPIIDLETTIDYLG